MHTFWVKQLPNILFSGLVIVASSLSFTCKAQNFNWRSPPQYGQGGNQYNSPANTGQYQSNSGFQQQSIPGIDISRLSQYSRGQLFSILPNEQCSCGCGYNMLQCRIHDPGCNVSLQRAQQLVAMLKSREQVPAMPRGGNPRFPQPNIGANQGNPAPPNFPQSSSYQANKPSGANYSPANTGIQSPGMSVTRPDGTQLNLRSRPCTQEMMYEMQQIGMSTQDIREVMSNMCNQ